jgi:hypothetical protein
MRLESAGTKVFISLSQRRFSIPPLTMQKFESKVSDFSVVPKPSPFGPDSHFRQLRIEPEFDNVAAYFRSGPIELRFLQTRQ